MTHDELLEKFTDYEAHFDQVQDEPKVFAMLRAVVELHKPVKGHEHLCSACFFGDGLQAYPCQTIVAITKELE
jgi:hypothetical protein